MFCHYHRHIFNTLMKANCISQCTSSPLSLQQTITVYYMLKLDSPHILYCWLCKFAVGHFISWNTCIHLHLNSTQRQGFLAACEVVAVYLQVQAADYSTVEQTVDDALCSTPWAFLSGRLCHRPSIMARRSSPLLLALGDWSPDSVNSPMILASSALACWSCKTVLSTSARAVRLIPHYSKSC